jgi:WD40 repeat protein
MGPDGNWAITSDGSELVTVWNLNRSQEKIGASHAKRVSAVAWSPDGLRVVSVAWEPRAIVWDPATGDAVGTGTGSTALSAALFLPPAHNRIMLAGLFEGFCVDSATFTLKGPWQPSRVGPFQDLSGPFVGTSALAATPNGSALIVGRADGNVLVMDTRSGEVLAGGVVHKGGIERIYCVNDELALSAGSDGRLVIWSLSEPHRLRTIASSDGAIFAFALLSNARIAWGEHDGTVRIARLKDMEELAVFKLHKGTVTMLSAIWSSEALVSAAHDGRVRVWRPDDGSIVTEMQLDRPLSCGAVAPEVTRAPLY